MTNSPQSLLSNTIAWLLTFIAVPLILCVGVYFYVMAPRLVAGTGTHFQPQEQMDRIRMQIVAYVDSHPEHGELSLAQLRAAGAISENDEAVVQHSHFQYQPVLAASGDGAVVFDGRRENGHQIRYHKRYGLQNWYACDSNPQTREYSFVRPANSIGRMLTRTLVNNTTGKTICSYTSAGNAARAEWDANGRCLAVIEKPESGSDELVLMVPNGDKIFATEILSELNLAKYLPRDYQNARPAFACQKVDEISWHKGRLYVGWRASRPDNDPLHHNGDLMFRSNFQLDIDATGKASVCGRVQISVKKPPKLQSKRLKLESRSR